jgi:RND superfamily putative drug exporter
MLDGLARRCVRHRRRVVLAWFLILVAAFAANRLVGEPLAEDFSFGHVESERAQDLLGEHFPDLGGPDVRVVYRADDGRLTDGDVDDLIAAVEDVEHVAGTDDPVTAPDGRTGFTSLHIEAETEDGELPKTFTEDLHRAIAESAAARDLTVGLSGEGFDDYEVETGPAELLGLGAAVVVLLLTFGSPLAAALPIVTALFALVITTLSLTVIGRWVDIPVMAPALSGMIGLGVGIDYALFILTRHRSGLASGNPVEDAAALAMRTAGRAVVFAGATVVVSMLGMLLVGIDVVRGLAIAAALAVLMTMLATLTLLPALLGLMGTRLEKARVQKGGTSHRWSRTVQRHPVVATVLAATFLLVLAAPMLSLQVGLTDAGSNPEGSPTRVGYDLLADGFGPGLNGPLLLVVEDGDAAEVRALKRAVDGTEGVLATSPVVTSDDDEIAFFTAIPTTSPQDEGTSKLVHRLRDDVVPLTDLDVVVGGRTAVDVDLSERVSSRLPAFMGAVLVLSFLLLMTVFRSLALPLKAVLMNLLSIGAAYGVVVAVFQWGWAADVLGVERTGPIEPFFPMFLFAILFGLSMDYEVFLLSRVHEEYVRTGDNSRAVADGLAATAGVITAAAAIMVVIFASFLTSDDRLLKLFGLGLTVAILVDATVVRLILVPASMELMGRANWWLPGWLDRRLPHVAVEAES